MRLHRILAMLWLLLMLLAAGFVWQQSQQHSLVRTDILDFLPRLQTQQDIQAAVDLHAERESRQLVVLLTGAAPEALAQAADVLSAQLVQTGRWSLSPSLKGAGDVAALWQWYRPFATALLSADDRAQLQQEQFPPFWQDVLLRYVNPMGAASGLLQQDPLFLLQDYLAANVGLNLNVSVVSGWPVIRRDSEAGLIAVFVAQENVYSLQRNAVLAQDLFAAQQQLAQQFPAVQLHATGALLHVFHSVKQSQAEISIVGAGSMVCILLLFLVIFRSPLPLLISSLVLGGGLLLGFAAMIALFGRVHMMALVFCSTVLGMGTDYTLHYFAHHHGNASAMATLKKIIVPTGLGMSITVLAFLALTLAPFPGFQQLALMSALGVAAVWTTMVLWLPYLPWRTQRLTWIARWLETHSAKTSDRPAGPVRVLAVVLALLVLGAGASRLQPNDDIRQLQAVFPQLQNAESQLQDWLGIRFATAYFLVTGADDEAVLTRMEQLCDQLRATTPALASSAQCLSDWLPSIARQQQNHAALQKLAEHGDVVWRGLEELGVPADRLTGYRQQLQNNVPFITPEFFWQGPAAARVASLWLGQTGPGATAAVVRVAGVDDPARMATLAQSLPGVHWVDQVQQYSDLFGHFRHNAALYVFAAYACMLLVLMARYGIKGGLIIVWPVLAGALAVLAVFGFSGWPFNLFTTLALIVVAGMAIDYGIFFRESHDAPGDTVLAVLLSAATTLLAFGLLALSETAAISGFGKVILIGISVVLACTLLTRSFNVKQTGEA